MNTLIATEELKCFAVKTSDIKVYCTGTLLKKRKEKEADVMHFIARNAEMYHPFN